MISKGVPHRSAQTAVRISGTQRRESSRHAAPSLARNFTLGARGHTIQTLRVTTCSAQPSKGDEFLDYTPQQTTPRPASKLLTFPKQCPKNSNSRKLIFCRCRSSKSSPPERRIQWGLLAAIGQLCNFRGRFPAALARGKESNIDGQGRSC